MNTIKQNLFLVKFSDFKGFIMVIFAFFPAMILRVKNPDIWLLCERYNEARDNAFALFEYLQNNEVNVKSYYAIDNECHDSKKLKKYQSNVIEFGSFKHYVYWLACNANVSSVKNSGPNNLIGYVFRKLNIMNTKQVFLQHGIIFNDLEWLHYSKAKFGVFCTNAIEEYEYVKKHFGYPNKNLLYTGGQPRYDKLLIDDPYDFNYILVMPTWRKWLKPGDPNMEKLEGSLEFEKSNYYQKWESLINNSNMLKLLSDNNLKLIFYPHPTMQNYINDFKSTDDRIVIADGERWDLSRLIRNAKMLITDYSSVYFDFVYQEKPIVSYQYDIDVFRANHYKKGYISYDNNPFFDQCKDENSVLNECKTIINDNFVVSSKRLDAMHNFFVDKHSNNCQVVYNRIYRLIND